MAPVPREETSLQNESRVRDVDSSQPTSSAQQQSLYQAQPTHHYQNQANIHRRMHVLDIPRSDPPSGATSPLTASGPASANTSVSDLAFEFGNGVDMDSPMDAMLGDYLGSGNGSDSGAQSPIGLSIPNALRNGAENSGTGNTDHGRRPGPARRGMTEEDTGSSASEYSYQASPISAGPMASLSSGRGQTVSASSSGMGWRGDGNDYAGMDGEEVVNGEDGDVGRIKQERDRIVSGGSTIRHATESGWRSALNDDPGLGSGSGSASANPRFVPETRPLSLTLRPARSGSEDTTWSASASGSSSASGTAGFEVPPTTTTVTTGGKGSSLSPYTQANTHLALPHPTKSSEQSSSSSSSSSPSLRLAQIPKTTRMAFMAPPDVSPGSLDRVEQAIQTSAVDYMGDKHVNVIGSARSSLIRDRDRDEGYKRMSERSGAGPESGTGSMMGGQVEEDRDRTKSAPAWKQDFTDAFDRDRVPNILSLNSPALSVVTGRSQPLNDTSTDSTFGQSRSKRKSGSGSASPIEHPFFNMNTTSPAMMKQASGTFADQTPEEKAGPAMMTLTDEPAKRMGPSRKASQSVEDSDSFAAVDSSPSLQSMSSFGASSSSLGIEATRPTLGIDNLPSRSSSKSIPAVRIQRGSFTRPDIMEQASSYSSRSSAGLGYSLPAKPSAEQIASKIEHSMQRFSVQTLRRPASLKSLRSQSSVDLIGKRVANTTTNRPWPAAMLFGNVKALRTAGARADGYARAINELNAADSGLRAWQEAARRKSKAPAAPRDRKRSKMDSVSDLGVRASIVSPRQSYTPTLRNVSGGSDVFPMRADATVAKEITVQLVDPANPPDALPANLPYPQLQAVAAASGMKASPSMSSVRSVGGGFGLFSKVGRLTGSKKAKELAAYNHNLSPVADSPKRDSIDSFDRQTAIPTPAGPRDHRTSISSQDRRSSLRSSIDKPRQRNSMSSQGPIMKAAISAPTPLRKDDMRGMTDVLPSANPAVLEAYMKREGDPMRAIGAYIEDEKAGKLMTG